jgi:hypothetical protein
MPHAALRAWRGFAVIILPAYMTALGFDAASRRHCRHASLLRHRAADARSSGWIAPRFDLRARAVRRRLMTATGPCLSQCRASRVIALTASRHHQSLRRRSRRPCRMEAAVLARTASDERRTQVFARY